MRQIVICRRFSLTFAIAAVGTLAVAAARGQGLLIDSRPGIPLPRPIVVAPAPQPRPSDPGYRIESLAVEGKLDDAVARVQVSQTFENVGDRAIEASFVFPLPYDAAIDQLTLLIDGKEHAGRLLSAEEARRRYEEIVRQSRDPALLEWAGSGMFQTSVFPLPARAKRTITLKYTQICRKRDGLVDFLFPLAAAKYTAGPVEKITIRLSIAAGSELKSVYSPTHNVEINRGGERRAVVTYEATKSLPAEDLRLLFDAGDDDLAASVVAYRPDDDEDGYFLLLASPRLEQRDSDRVAKTVVIAVDRSGSMSGEKMDQAKEALKFVINRLRPGDTFNIVAYDSEVEAFRPELQRVDDATRDAALAFASGLYAGGSTDIDGALQRTLGMLKDSDRPSYVLFLTDGLPTIGETSEAKIARRAADANDVRARLFVFGVGYDVNSRLLDRLARDGHGQSDYVRPDENLETAVSGLYRRIGAPAATDVELALEIDDARAADGAVANRVYPEGPFDLFAGTQAVIVGRYRLAGAAKVVLRGEVGGTEKAFEFPATLAEHSEDDANAFVAKLWATRRVGEIIDELDLKGENDELIKELVDLATRHGILTQYTAFLAEEEAAREPHMQRRDAARRLSDLQISEGRDGVRQRAAKQMYRSAALPASSSLDARGGAGGIAPMSESSLESLARTSGRGVAYYDAAADRQTISARVIAVGGKTFFRRGEQWVDSSARADQVSRPRRVERFSREYFDLAARYGRRLTPYLAIDGEIVVQIDGELLSIVAAADDAKN